MGCASVKNIYSIISCCTVKNSNINENIIKYLAFSPPKKCNYNLNEIDSLPFSSNYKICKFTHKNYRENIYPWIDVLSYKLKKTNSNQLAVLHIKNIKYL